MAFIADIKTGDITLVQGDSGELVLDGLNTDKNYTVYFSVYDSHRNAIGSEISVSSNRSSTVVIVLSAQFTDLLTVPKKEAAAIYYYGIKVCDTDGFEDTVCVGDKDIGELNIITVYPKTVEGAA